MLTSRAPALTTCIAQWGTIWCAGPMTTPSPFWWCSGGPLLSLPSATDPARDSSSSGCLLPCRDYLPAAFVHLKYPSILKNRLPSLFLFIIDRYFTLSNKESNEIISNLISFMQKFLRLIFSQVEQSDINEASGQSRKKKERKKGAFFEYPDIRILVAERLDLSFQTFREH